MKQLISGYKKRSDEAQAGQKEAERAQRDMSKRMMKSMDDTTRARDDAVDTLCQQAQSEKIQQEKAREMEASMEAHVQEMAEMRGQMDALRKHVVDKDQEAHQELHRLRAQVASRYLGPVGQQAGLPAMISQGISSGVGKSHYQEHPTCGTPDCRAI